MSDIALNWGPLDLAFIALIIGWPGLFAGAVVGLLAWRRHRLLGIAIGATVGLLLCVAARLALKDFL